MTCATGLGILQYTLPEGGATASEDPPGGVQPFKLTLTSVTQTPFLVPR